MFLAIQSVFKWWIDFIESLDNVALDLKRAHYSRDLQPSCEERKSNVNCVSVTIYNMMDMLAKL